MYDQKSTKEIEDSTLIPTHADRQMLSACSSSCPILTPTYAAREMTGSIRRYVMPERSRAPDTIYNLIHDELMLDGNARQNLATFVTTWMEPEAARLMRECFNKNMIDKDEYPKTAEIESWVCPECDYFEECEDDEDRG